MLTAITILAAIGDITRFPSAKKLVGYAGLGTRVHDSGMTHSSGRDHEGGQKRSALRHGERRQSCGGTSCSLEKGVGKTDTTPGSVQGDCGDCPQASGSRLACTQ